MFLGSDESRSIDASISFSSASLDGYNDGGQDFDLHFSQTTAAETVEGSERDFQFLCIPACILCDHYPLALISKGKTNKGKTKVTFLRFGSLSPSDHPLFVSCAVRDGAPGSEASLSRSLRWQAQAPPAPSFFHHSKLLHESSPLADRSSKPLSCRRSEKKETQDAIHPSIHSFM